MSAIRLTAQERAYNARYAAMRAAIVDKQFDLTEAQVTSVTNYLMHCTDVTVAQARAKWPNDEATRHLARAINRARFDIQPIGGV